MSPFGKIVVAVIVIAAVVGGVWYFTAEKSPNTPTDTQTTTETSEETRMKMSADASIDEGMLMIDSELRAVDQDSSKVDQGLNDKPVEQTE